LYSYEYEHSFPGTQELATMEGGLVRSAMNESFVSMVLTRSARADNPETIK
jgi:hypothetical protein